MKSVQIFFFLFFFASLASAHHSDAGMDLDAVVIVEGEVVEFSWRQPHAYVVIENDRGEEWEVEMGPPNVLIRRGWTSNTVVPGDRVSARVHPMRNGRTYGKYAGLERISGEPIQLTRDNDQAAEARASSLNGKWIADRSSITEYPGGFDGFFNAQLQLTEKAEQAKASYDPLSPDNPEATCVGRPTPAALVSTVAYLMQIDLNDGSDEVIYIRSEWFDEERTIYMDGRGHPDPSQTFVTGHSIGWWEGDTLVVDTANFDDHRSPYQVGVPSGPQKHVVERYELQEGGTRASLDFVLEDPEYLTEPLISHRLLVHSPQMEMFVGGCDIENTGRFVN